MEFKFRYSTDNDVFLEAKRLRDKVFIEEQNCSIEEEYDEYDIKSFHFVGYENKDLICCARIIQKEDKKWYLGRIAVFKEFRGKGFGYELINYLINYFVSNVKEKKLYLNSQTHAIEFYEKFNFIKTDIKFVEAEIEHVLMVKTF